jgi:formyl-CoA transferase
VLSGRDRWRQVPIPGGRTVAALIPPVDLDGTEPRMDAVPALGEHTDAVLAALGHGPDRIAALRARGVV